VATGDVTFSAFGWRDGLLESRGFHIVGAQPRTASSFAASMKSDE
jgi:hypothetical protein